MKRSETLTIRIRPDLKEGFKAMFRGNTVSDSFELLFMGFINGKKDWWKENLESNTEALNLYRKDNNNIMEAVEASMLSNIETANRELNKLYEISQHSFPNHSVEVDKAVDAELDFLK